MGNHSEFNDLFVGEIQFSPDGKIAIFPCFLTDASNVSVIVQDEAGRTKMDERYSLEKGSGNIEFDVSNLSGGSYNAWIELSGKTFIRGFQIHKLNGDGSWLEKLKGIFN